MAEVTGAFLRALFTSFTAVLSIDGTEAWIVDTFSPGSGRIFILQKLCLVA